MESCAARYFARAGRVLLLAALAYLPGCQGVSTSGSGSGGSAAPETGQLTVSPATLDLGSVAVGASGTASGSLAASNADVTVTAASTSNSEFSVGGLSLPLTIPAGHSAPFTVTFSPHIAGSASGTLTFNSTSRTSTTTETLTGTGTEAQAHSVNLSWSDSSSPNISGYNIYRTEYGTSCGTYRKISSMLNTSTLYTDSSVEGGRSYCYAVTAVNTSNAESAYSNIVSDIQIPTP